MDAESEAAEAGHPADDPASGGALTRRRLLLGAGAAAITAVGAVGLVEAGVLPGRTRLRTALGQEGPDGTIPDITPGPRRSGSFRSAHRRTRTAWSVSYPPGEVPGASLPVLVVLHGRGGDHRSAFDDLGLDRFLAASVAVDGPPFAIASVDGGDSYWHRRRDGTDSGAMVVDELVPLLGQQGLDTGRVGLAGWSMGGYGALLLAERHADAIGLRCASTLSAALWEREADAAPGAFDGQADFAANDVFAGRSRLTVPLRMDCGRDDPFHAAGEALRASVDPAPAGGSQRGVHTMGYWRRLAPLHVRFAARHLTD